MSETIKNGASVTGKITRSSTSTISPTGEVTKRKRSTRSEIDRLLSDEGTLNMLNSINTLVPADPKRTSTETKQSGGAGGGVNLVVTPFRNMRGSNVKKKLVNNGKKTRADESKIVRRRSSDNSSSTNSLDGSHYVSPNSASTLGSQSFMKRRSSLLSTLIIREDDNGIDHARQKGNSGSNSGKSILGKGISDEKRFQGQQRSLTNYEEALLSSRQSNLYEPMQDSNSRTILCNRSDEGTVGHVTIAYLASNHMFTLTPKALDEFTATLEELNNDKAIKLIIVTSSGRGVFCAGLDISCLITNDLMRRKLLAEEMAKKIKKLFQTLSKLKKVCIASLNGDVEGFGCTMLPLFDLVYASDKCTFKIIPEYSEGVSIFGSEYIRHNKIINSMIYAGRRLTAQEAMNAGIVTEILWPAKFHEEVFLRIRNILKMHRSAQTMESLKKILTKSQNLTPGGIRPSSSTPSLSTMTNSSPNQQYHQLFRPSLELESKTLIDKWISNKFQETYKKAVISQIIKF